MLVAVCDQSLGTSTFRCSKIVWPFSFWMDGRAQLPLDFIKRMNAGLGKKALYTDTLLAGRFCR